MRVSKKDECLARALLEWDLEMCGFPEEDRQDRVDEAWPAKLYKAQFINMCISMIQNYELAGETSEDEIRRWTE